MYLFRRSADLQKWLQTVRGHHRTIGFVPTMGALHLALLRNSLPVDSSIICSIFVNPTQFNDAADLKKYPRTPARDIELLALNGCDALFMPTLEEVYPQNVDTSVAIELGQLDRVMEGKFRPGHFGGVVQVVHRLLELVQPDRLYMGQKDFQQLTIIREMIRQLKLPVELIMVDIEREADGLAMSSRNVQLNRRYRQIAPVIYQTLQRVRNNREEKRVPEWKKWAIRHLEEAGLRPEYCELVDGDTLQPVAFFSDSDYVVACAAAWAGNVRLIDNVIVKQPTADSGR